MDLKERDALGDQADSHWYYVSKARMITQHIKQKPKTILDVGAGLGWFSKWLLENDFAARSICVDPGYDVETTQTVGTGKPIDYVKSIDQSNANLVLLMDVLEHVDDDVGLLQEYWDKSPKGTTFIITVPAFAFLWSAHDDFLDHRRRYTISSLRETIAATGAKPDQLHYYFGAIFPLVAAIRLLKRGKDSDSSDMKPVSNIVNTVLKSICALEARVTRFNKIAGLSVVARLVK